MVRMLDMTRMFVAPAEDCALCVRQSLHSLRFPRLQQLVEIKFLVFLINDVMSVVYNRRK